MEVMPKKAVVAAAIALVAVAAVGAYQGWRRSSADEAQTGADGNLLPTTAAVTGARTASALIETTPTLTESQVRDIARQEVRASLRGDSAAASESAATAATTTTPPIGAGATPPPPRVAPAAPVVPPAPTATPDASAASNAPLF